MWMGTSERNLHELFQAARRHAPCVLFLDEVDALGHKRSQLNTSAMRTLGNQLLAELDGKGDNEGVFVLAATNAPWDVDPARDFRSRGTGRCVLLDSRASAYAQRRAPLPIKSRRPSAALVEAARARPTVGAANPGLSAVTWG
jgi:ATP-dependent Zn protease